MRKQHILIACLLCIGVGYQSCLMSSSTLPTKKDCDYPKVYFASGELANTAHKLPNGRYYVLFEKNKSITITINE